MKTREEIKSLFLKLIDCEEGQTVDFKRNPYKFNNCGKKADFLVDICAMLNTPNGDYAHIVLGITKKPGETAQLIGIKEHIDDSYYSNYAASGTITPIPSIEYMSLEYHDKIFGIIEIHKNNDGPFQICKPIEGKSIDGKIYYRNGSTNTVADPSQIRRIIENNKTTPVKTIVANPMTDWDLILETTDRFNKSYCYTLISAGKIEKPIRGIECLPWNLIIDFDTQSDTDGLYSYSHEQIEERRLIKISTIGDTTEINKSSTIWHFPIGLKGRNELKQTDNPYTEWVIKGKKHFSKTIESSAKKLLPWNQIVFIIIEDSKYNKIINSISEIFIENYAEKANIILINNSNNSLKDITNIDTFSTRPLTIETENLFTSLKKNETYDSDEPPTLPGPSGTTITLDQKDLLWIQEDFEILATNTETHHDEDAEQFRKGGNPSWSNLDFGHDCQRTLIQKLLPETEKQLESRFRSRVNLYHQPGAGGSTLAKKVAWEIHSKFPTMLLKNLESQHLAAKIERITSTTNKPALVIIDTPKNDRSQLDKLYTDIRARQIAATLLIVQRVHKKRKAEDFYLKNSLDNKETSRFYNAYTTSKPERKGKLTELLNNKEYCSPFTFGLYAYEKEFIGIKDYVMHRVKKCTDDQKDILTFYALAHYYAQETLPFIGICDYFNVKAHSIHDLFGNTPTTSELLYEDQKGFHRPLHYLISKEILLNTLGKDKEHWSHNIVDYSKLFIDFLSNSSGVTPEIYTDIAKHIFISRNENNAYQTDNGGSFSLLIEDAIENGRKNIIFKELVSGFPDEPHFIAHYGRLKMEMEDFDTAIEFLEKAIDMSNGDPSILHMRGMVHKKRISHLIANNTDLEDLIEDIRMASNYFTQSREVQPVNEHPYISEIQVWTKIANYAAKLLKCKPSALIDKPIDSVFRYSIQQAESVLYSLEQSRRDDKPSGYEINCKSDIYKLHGDFSNALQCLDNALSHPICDKIATRKQIVWTLLRKASSWKEMDIKSIERSIHLLEQNILDAKDEMSMRMWIRAVRYSTTPRSVESVLNKVSLWRTTTHSLDSFFYSYVLSFLLALEGATLEATTAYEYITYCKNNSLAMKNRIHGLEWLGRGDGFSKLIHYTDIEKKDVKSLQKNLYLSRVTGRVSRIKYVQGYIDLNGFDVFFNPNLCGIEQGRDENKLVDFYLTFSYDGLQARDVKPLD